MKKKIKSIQLVHPDEPSRWQPSDDPDKQQPHPEDPNEQKGPPMREMPVKNGPHDEEILDRIL
jgi:hypothetical protein